MKVLRSAGNLVLMFTGLTFGAGLLTAGQAGASPLCPPGTTLVRYSCVPIGSTTTTTLPLAELPPITLPPITLPPITLPPVTAPPLPIVSQPLPGPAATVPNAASHLLDLVNGERSQAGLRPLVSRDDLVTIALKHSQDMAAAGDIFHNDNFFTAAVKRLLNSAMRGENVAYNGDVDNAHLGLMGSPGHRHNILDPRFSFVGIAVVHASDGRYFITQDFLQPAGASRAPRRPRVASLARTARPATVRKAAVVPLPAPVTTVPTTSLPVPVTAPVPVQTVPADAVLQLNATPIDSATMPTESGGGPATIPSGGAAAVLLVGATAACVLVPRRRAA